MTNVLPHNQLRHEVGFVYHITYDLSGIADTLKPWVELDSTSPSLNQEIDRFLLLLLAHVWETLRWRLHWTTDCLRRCLLPAQHRRDLYLNATSSRRLRLYERRHLSLWLSLASESSHRESTGKGQSRQLSDLMTPCNVLRWERWRDGKERWSLLCKRTEFNL
jgi:hypothetical protein